MHAQATGDIMREAGYDEELIDKVCRNFCMCTLQVYSGRPDMLHCIFCILFSAPASAQLSVGNDDPTLACSERRNKEAIWDSIPLICDNRLNATPLLSQVERLIKKQRLKEPEGQAVEDALCLCFLEHQLPGKFCTRRSAFWEENFRGGMTEDMPENVHYCTLNPANHCPLSQLKPSWLYMKADIVSCTRMCLYPCKSQCEQIDGGQSSP
jgi:hypothetical protein